MKKKLLSIALTTTLAASALFTAQVSASAATYQGESITLNAKVGNKADTYSKTFENVKSITVPGHTFSVYKWNEWKCTKSDYVEGYISSRVTKNSNGTYTLYLWSRAKTGKDTIKVTYNNGDISDSTYTVANQGESITLNAKVGNKADTYSKTFENVRTITVPGHTFSVSNWDKWNCSKSDYVEGYISSRVVKNSNGTYTLYLWSRASSGTGTIESVYNNGDVAHDKYTVEKQGESITLGAKSNGKSDTCAKIFKNISSITVPGHTFSVSNWDKWNCSKSDFVDGYISSRVVKNNDGSYTLYLWSRAQTGTGTIRVNYNNGEVHKYTYTVKLAPTSISLNETLVYLQTGEQFDLDSSVPIGQKSHQVVYTSDNSEIAEVKASGGIVTANAPGEATITATAYNGVSVSCTVKVNWHEAVYEYIDHPAETKSVWIIDEPEYAYEEGIYESHTICKGCVDKASKIVGYRIWDIEETDPEWYEAFIEAKINPFIGEMTPDERTEHLYNHIINDENSGSYTATVRVGTQTITVPEEGHWETVVIKEAWTEKIVVRKEGYY